MWKNALTYVAICDIMGTDEDMEDKIRGGATGHEKTPAQFRHGSCTPATQKLKNKEKTFEIRRFRRFLVEISGIEPLTS